MAALLKQLCLVFIIIFTITAFADCSTAWAEDIRPRLKPPSKDKKYNVEVGPVKIKPMPKGNVKKNYAVQTGPIKKMGPATDKKVEAQAGPSEKIKMQKDKAPDGKVDVKIDSIKPIDGENTKKAQAPDGKVDVKIDSIKPIDGENTKKAQAPKVEIIDVKAWKLDKEGKKTDEEIPIKMINREMQSPSDVNK
ncbi:MAG: hypothetical protein HZB79_07385 [Deltaproteobacteria bacterium]|nr:hypothetical protein [Deltaproteobacteria bacterium]